MILIETFFLKSLRFHALRQVSSPAWEKLRCGLSVFLLAALMLLYGAPGQAAPPAITQHPQDVTVAAGQFVTFSVSTSTSDATYQWQVSTNGFDFSIISGATESTYTFKPVRVSETGTRYRVVVSKDGESVYSSPATLTVTKAASIVLVDELPQGRVYGQSVQIKAIVIGTSAQPHGEITFMDGNTRIGDVSFDTSNGASLTITTNELGAGQHTITAVYSGDENHEPGVSSGVVIDIAKADQSIYFDTVPPQQAIVGQTYEVTAHAMRVSQSVPIEVKGESGDICTVSNGVVTFLNVGTCVLSAQNMGDANFNDSQKATQMVPVIAAPAHPPPAVTSVSVPANGYYGTGDRLDFTVSWGGNVDVNTGGGTPYIPLTIGATTRQASYLSGSGSSAFVFTYAVQPGDVALHGVSLGSGIVANGGTIRDFQGTDADLTLNNIGSTSLVLIYAVNPEVVSTRVIGSPDPDADSVTFEVTFSEPVTGFTGSDLVLTSSGTASGRLGVLQTSDNITYTVQVDDISGSGTLRLDVLANAVDNVGGNSNAAFTDGTPLAVGRSIALTPSDGSTLSNGLVGTAYNDGSISATGGVGTITFSATGLPPGLSIDPATGAITGTPTADGTFTVAVTATGATSGTATASYTIVIAAAPLPVSLAPADGSTLTAGVVGTVYSNGSISATGGVGTITFSATGLPTGLVIDGASGAITGTPTAEGAFTVNVTANAAISGSASARYAIVVAPAPPVLTGISPATGSTMGGTALTITGNHLTGATAVMLGSVAATSIKVVSNTHITAIAPANVAGSADVSVTAPGGTATLTAAFTYIAPALTFSPASGSIPGGTAGVEYTRAVSVTGGTAPYSFSATGLPEAMGIDPRTGTIHGLPTTPGTYTLVVKVRDQNGLSGTATYSLTLGGIYRPDPSQDTEVIGLINAQAQAAQRFATTQISNFNDRLERLHSDQSRHAQSLGIRIGVTQDADRTEPIGSEEDRPDSDPAGRTMGGRPHKEPAAEVGTAAQPLNAVFGDTAFWSGGFVNFGTSERGNIDLGHTLIGVSGGVDHRFAPDFVAGFGLGYGRDRTDIGSSGTTSTGQAFSAALYGSYHPAPFYLDGLLGVSRLDFDSTRYVTTTGDFATGSRDGTQIFGSLSAGYEHRQEGLLFSPYGRIEAAHTRLDGFTETGAGPYSLAFGGQTFDMLAGVLGMRAEHAIPMEWGVLNTRGRLEYTHDFSGSSQASMGYSDLGTMPYTLDLDRYMRDYLTVGLGVDAKLQNDMTVSFDYRTAFGFDGTAQNHTFGIRIGGNF
ncbi:autotransporter domain-containing protein [Neorhizobium sp. DT-125]|uniref:autotransporter domain-containing protein n=1 Tax=Neorhizobium sp. DT-125 TaxID=3396163 RepID=UPI003F1A2F65